MAIRTRMISVRPSAKPVICAMNDGVRYHLEAVERRETAMNLVGPGTPRRLNPSRRCQWLYSRNP
jgi:hypothetical protein